MTTTETRERTGNLTTLLPPLSAVDRGSQTIHAAEETVVPLPANAEGITSLLYAELTALCGQRGWGAADRPLTHVNCQRCLRTARFQEATR